MSVRPRDESGATLIFVALVLTLLMGAAAVAIDLSAGFNERRQDQTSADLAVLAGALSYPDYDAIVEEVMATARLNVDGVYSDAEWIALWQNCTDSYPGFTGITHSTLGTIDCIGIHPSFLRVRVPDQLVDTSFGRILGFDSLSTHAGAIVQLIDHAGAGALPFAVRGDASPGFLCLDTGPRGQAVDECNGPERGSFGNIAPPRFGVPGFSTPDCSGQVSGENVAPAIAMGIDHELHSLASIPGNPDDNPRNNAVDAYANMDECIDEGGDFAAYADGYPINGVYIDTGNNAKADVTLGLMTGTNFADGYDARLTRSSNTRMVGGYALDNTPLWSHLLLYSNGPLDGGPCDGDTYASEPDTQSRNARMAACLQLYEALPSPQQVQIFADTILTNNPRLGLAPRLWHNNLGSGVSFRPIKSFDLVYIGGLWFDDRDKTVFHPDGTTTSDITLRNWRDVEQVTAFLLVDSMVSAFVLENTGRTTPANLDPTLYE